MKRVVRNPPYWYLRTQLEFEEKSLHVDIVAMRTMIMQAMTTLHGQVGGSIQVDVLQHQTESGSSILRVAADSVVKLWSSMTLLGEYDGHRLRILVKQSSPFLMSLAVDSRQFVVDMKHDVD
ncbi:ribonuclease P protein subunit p14-like [Corticium candelabrum]|uniref:ribonuclease P protein subunit p14-like n=1 Tax=Corticium candelabrum TaxID=121492 RepID=UPI002E31017C|nr:ribonuclease P protein subunit p14-like [Corticium candelabrum]